VAHNFLYCWLSLLNRNFNLSIVVSVRSTSCAGCTFVSAVNECPNGFTWLREWISGGLLCARCRTFGIYKMRGISWVYEEPVTLQERWLWYVGDATPKRINFENFCTPNKISANYSWRLNFTRWRMGFKRRVTHQSKVSPVKKLHELPVRSRTFVQCRAMTVERVQKQSHTPYTIWLFCTKVASLSRNARELRRWQAPCS